MNVGGEGSKSVIRSVDGTVHAILAVRGTTAEVPDGGGSLGNLERVNADFTRGGIIGNKARVEAIGVESGVELPGARVSQAALSYGVVATSELEVDNITNFGLDVRGIKDKTSGTIRLLSSDVYGDFSRECSRSDSGDDGKGGSELHFDKLGEEKKSLKELRSCINESIE